MTNLTQWFIGIPFACSALHCLALRCAKMAAILGKGVELCVVYQKRLKTKNGDRGLNIFMIIAGP